MRKQVSNRFPRNLHVCVIICWCKLKQNFSCGFYNLTLIPNNWCSLRKLLSSSYLSNIYFLSGFSYELPTRTLKDVLLKKLSPFSLSFLRFLLFKILQTLVGVWCIELTRASALHRPGRDRGGTGFFLDLSRKGLTKKKSLNKVAV